LLEIEMYAVGANKHKGRPRWREGGLLAEFRLDDAVHSTEMGARITGRELLSTTIFYWTDLIPAAHLVILVV